MRLGAYLVDRRPLAVPAFRRLWTASVVTAVGGSFSLIAVPVQLFDDTGSSAAVGVAAIVSLVALVVTALTSGALADALDRRRLLLAGNAVLGAAYLGLWLQAALGLHSVPVVLGLVLLQGAGYGITMTTAGAAVPRVVPGRLLVAANALSSLARSVGAIVGPLVAGALIPVVGLAPLYLCDALALVAVLAAVARLPALPPTVAPVPVPGSAAAPARGWWISVPRAAARIARDVAAGARHLRHQPVLLAILGVDLAAMVFGFPIALFPELATGYGPGALGLLFAAYPAGVLLAGLASGPLSRTDRHGAMMAGAAIAWGACVVVLGLARPLGWGLAALVVGGAVNFGLSTFRNAISQAHTDDALRGRIQGILTVVLIGGPQVANVLHGLGGAWLGARVAITIGGALTVVAVLGILARTPLWRYRPADSPPDPAATSPADPADPATTSPADAVDGPLVGPAPAG